MAVLRLSTAARNAATAAISTLVDAGAGAGTVKIYSGAQPATPNTAASGMLLATVVLGDPSFSAPVNGTATGADPASVTAVASGAAGWFRIADSDGNAVMDGDVTATGGGGSMQLANVDLVAGGTVDITAVSHATPLG